MLASQTNILGLFMKKILSSFVLCVIVSFFAINAFATDNTQKNEIAQTSDELNKKLGIDEILTGSKLLVLDSKHGAPHFYMFKRFKKTWILINDSIAQVGRGGVKDFIYEGENATPRGLYGLKIAFGHKKNPGCILPYYQLRDGDVWVTDPQSRYYNLFVRENTVRREWGRVLDLYDSPLPYEYVLVIDYNIINREPYKGSGIFIQCSIGKPTNGSIAIPSSFMKDVMKFIDQDTKIFIN